MFCTLTANADNREDLENYCNYITRICLVNEEANGIDELIMAEAVAEEVCADDRTSEADNLSALNTLKQAMHDFIAKGTAENPAYVEGGAISNINEYIKEGWEMTNYSTSVNGNNIWYVAWSDNTSVMCKWGKGDANDAHKTVTNLPAGSYTLSMYTAADGGICYMYCQLNDGEKQTQDIIGTFKDIQFNLYIEEDGGSITFGVADYEGKQGWTDFHNISLRYMGTNILAPYQAKLSNVVAQLRSTITDVDGLVPASMTDALNNTADQYDTASYETVEEYEKAMDDINTLINQTKLCPDLYSAFMDLYGQKDEYPTVDCFDSALAAANAATNYAELNAAFTTLNQGIASYLYSIADADNPVVLYESGMITTLFGWVTNGTYTSNNGDNNWYIDKQRMVMWGASHGNYAYRQLDNVPNGLYTLSVDFMSSNEDEAELVFNGQTVSIGGPEKVYEQDFYLEEGLETLLFGINCPNPIWCDWCNMKLEYKGTDALAAYHATVERIVNKSNDEILEYDGTVPAAFYDRVSDYLLEIDASSLETVEECQAVLDSISTLFKELKEAQAAYLQYLEALNNAQVILDSDDYDTSNSVYVNFENVIEETGCSIEEAETMAEIDSITNLVNQAINEVGYEFASELTPYAIFQVGTITSTEGWITAGTQSRNNNQNDWFSDGSSLVSWGSMKTNYALRELELPAGKYMLKLETMSDFEINLQFNGFKVALGEDNKVEGEDHVYAVTFATIEEGTVQFGVDVPNMGWVYFKNMTLYYLGTEGAQDVYDDLVATGIESVKTSDKNAIAIYSLSGAKLAAPQKGINIIGGKKVLVK